MATAIATFTVAVFKDVASADKGLAALQKMGFTAEATSVLGKDSPELEALVSRWQTPEVHTCLLKRTGTVRCGGRLIDVLDGEAKDLATLDLGGTLRRAGFQPHDAQIFETLVGRGGVLVAIDSEPGAADALTVFHNYGGGNAAIGAWHGRV
jgi:hypothetical protein